MGSEREDTDPTSAKGGTEPGLGPKTQPNGAPPQAEPPPPVDFDALHAALGAVEEPRHRSSRPDVGEPTDIPSAPPPPPPPRVGESQGRSSAQYASARPHTIPPTRAPDEPVDIPAVIVAEDDAATVPSAPPQMTTPLGAPPASGPHAVPSSGPHHAAAMAQSPSYPHTPPPFPVQRLPAQPTMRMPERPRRPKNPTVVVRRRGPSTLQKLLAFVAALMLVVAAGALIVGWQKPSWLGLDKPLFGPVEAPTPTASAPALSTTATASAAPSTSPSASAAPSASASASVKIPPKPPPLKPHPSAQH